MADTLVPQGIAQKSRFFREISGNNEAGPLESSCTAASRTMCCLQMHPLTLTTAAAVACGPAQCAATCAAAQSSCEPWFGGSAAAVAASPKRRERGLK